MKIIILRIVLVMILALLLSSCSFNAKIDVTSFKDCDEIKKERPDITIQSPMTLSNNALFPVKDNESIISLSLDGKYCAEAYGTITGITAGGLYPYEGIRILRLDNRETIWKMEPGGYAVNFIWSPDSTYVGIYYTGRTWGESIVVDIKGKKDISLPGLSEIASYYGISAKPQDNRPDPYFEIYGWKDSETVIVSFRWTKEDGEEFSGEYTFNVKTNEAIYK